MCVEQNVLATPVTTATPLLGKQVRESATIFPSAKIVQKGAFKTDVGDALPVYHTILGKIKRG